MHHRRRTRWMASENSEPMMTVQGHSLPQWKTYSISGPVNWSVGHSVIVIGSVSFPVHQIDMRPMRACLYVVSASPTSTSQLSEFRSLTVLASSAQARFKLTCRHARLKGMTMQPERQSDLGSVERPRARLDADPISPGIIMCASNHTIDDRLLQIKFDQKRSSTK